MYMSSNTDIHISIPTNNHKFNINEQKTLFLINALDNGWTIRKKKDYYIFTKKHEGKREVFKDNYIHTFLEKNFDVSIL